MRTKIIRNIMVGLAGVGLLWCANARADISLMDGAGPNGLYSTNTFIGPATNADGTFDTNTVATFTMPFTVSTNLNTVLVVELTDDNHNPANASPSFMTWSNNVTGATQTLSLTKSVSSGTYNFYWLNTYYLYNPNPGLGTLIAVETNNIAAGSNTAAISVTNAYFHMSMQAFALKGVDTTYTPYAGGTGAAVASQLTTVGPNLPNYGYWAAFCANDSNRDTMTNSAVGNLFGKPYQPSGTTYYLAFPDLYAHAYEMNAYGYTANLLPRQTEFIATESSTGVGTQMSMEYTIFKPYDTFGGSYPTGVSASQNQVNHITVSWTGVSGSPTNYIVWRSTEKSGPFTMAGNSGTATSFVDTNVANGITYYYQVQAQNANGTSLYSLTSNGSGEATGLAVGIPPAPTGMTGATGTHSSLLSWDSQIGVTTYYIARSTTSGGETIVASTSGTATNYTDMAVTDGTKYYYEVAGSNSYGLGDFSAEVSAVPAVTFFTNYLGLFNGHGDMWAPETAYSTTTFISSNDVYNAGIQYPNLAFNFFMVPPPSGGLMDIGGQYAEQPATTNGFAGFTNTINGATRTFPYNLNISGYQYLEMDTINIGNATNTWNYLGGGGVGQIRPEFQVVVSNLPTFEQGQLNGQAVYVVMNNGGQGGTNFVHFTLPLNLWSGSTNEAFGGFDLSTVSAARIELYDADIPGTDVIPATNSIAGTNDAMWLDVGFANIKLSGAPAWACAFSGLSSPTISTGSPSVTLTGTVSSTVAGTNVYCWQGTPVSVTINGKTQTGAIDDAMGDFSIAFTNGVASLTQGVYQVTYAAPDDMVALVGATNNATSLTVSTNVAPPPTPTVNVSRSGNNLVLTVPNTSSTASYYLLMTTNLNPPVVWTTNSVTVGTGGTITNTVPITSGTPKQFIRYMVQ